MGKPVTHRSVFVVALAGVLVGVLLATTVLEMLPARGATGDNMILGRTNLAGLATKIRSNGASTLKVINTNGMGYGLDIYTKPGQPPFRVNRAALIPNLNADRLDNRHAAQLLPIVKKCSNDNISTTNFKWRCRVTFQTQHPGTFVMCGSVDAQNPSGSANYMTCRFRVSNLDLSYSWHPATIEPGGFGVCASDAAEGRAAGTYPIDFWVEWPAGLDPRKASMWVMWVPD